MILKLAQNQRRYLIWALNHNAPGNIYFKLPWPETYSERKRRKRLSKKFTEEHFKWYGEELEAEANKYGFSFKPNLDWKVTIGKE